MARRTWYFLTTVLIFIWQIQPTVYAQAKTADLNVDTTVAKEFNSFGRIIDDIIQKVEREVLRQMGYDVDPEEPSYADSEQQDERMRGAIHFTGNVVIDARDRIEGNVVIRDGSLTVRGFIGGDVLVLNGNVTVEEGGRIVGSVTTINGKVSVIGGEITGTVEEKTGVDVEAYYTVREKVPTERVRYHLARSLQDDLTARDIELSDFFVGFNRVEGFSLGFGSRKNLYWDGSTTLSLYGQLGYAFKAHRWRALLGGSRQFALGSGQLFEIGGEVYTLTETKDDWIIGRKENDLAAFFVHRDYRDYYDRQGFSLYTGHYMNGKLGSLHLRIQYLQEEHRSMENRTDWALFVKDRSFRVNPPIDEGNLQALRIGLNLSTVDKNSKRPAGWSMLAVAEIATPDIGGDFDYAQYTVDLRRYQPLSGYDNLNVRVRAGTSERELPVQRLYEIGGIGTLPAYFFKEFAGNRMVLFNAEYALSAGVLGQLKFLPRGFFSRSALLLFLDSGWTGMSPADAGIFDGFEDLSPGTLKTSVGTGIGSRDGSWRLGIAWRTDRKEDPVLFFRIYRPF